MKREVRVLHLITRYLDGGAEKTTSKQINSLMDSKEKYEIHLGFGVEYDREQVNHIKDQGVSTVCFRLIRHFNIVSNLLAILSVSIYLSNNEIDIVHTHSTEAGYIGRIAGWISGTDVVIHEVHGDPVTDDRNTLFNSFLIELERICARVTDKIITKSKIIRDTYLNRGIGHPEQYELIYHGVDLEKFDNVSPHRSLLDSGVTLLYVGRIEDGKGIFDMLKAYESVYLEANVEVQLLIVGTGDLIDAVRTHVRQHELEGVRVLGYREDIPQIMAASDILVLPSYREGTPRVITEALASDLTVISTDIAGIPEQVDTDSDHILIEPGDIDELCESIIKTINKKARGDLQSNSTELEKFSSTQSENKLIELYNKLITDGLEQ
ncbi:glycosyltransferase [Halorubrum ezzemoulense]|uniref:Glycosyltransferase subfamily 4-like N-terminal domain-containing protein n=1 Tax=Halorubrum ezzemoulense TaxID=337243 RepID=A0A256K518_HALEZ|nr:glycosyltransferase [Halorubrum ezzemoulense]OYR75652.1 hypothetical protein DJ76_01730 [Halorubrum ezzemoulense]